MSQSARVKSSLRSFGSLPLPKYNYTIDSENTDDPEREVTCLSPTPDLKTDKMPFLWIL